MDRPHGDLLGRAGPWLARAALFAVAMAVGILVARPIHGANIGFDSQSSVLYFERIIAGHRLETFVSTTPKPLQTIVYGLLFATTHDWRAIAWATIVAFAASVTLVADVAARVAGPVAWMFVGVAMTGSSALVFDTAFALATPWALVFVAAAGLALARPSPHPAAAGVLLACGALFRLEVLLVVSLAGLVLIGRSILPGITGGRRPGARDWLVLLGLLALPAMALHDQLLTGDPGYWTGVAVRYTSLSGFPVLDARAMVGWIASHLRSEWVITVMGLVGLARLLFARRWVELAGILAFGPGMAVFLVVLALRHVYVPDRYAAPIDLALIVASGVAAGWAAEGLVSGWRAHSAGSDQEHPAPPVARASPPARSRAAPAAVALLAAAFVAGFATWRGGLLDRGLQASIANGLAVAIDTARVEPTLQGIVSLTPGARSWPSAGTSANPLLRVPIAVRPRLAVDLAIPLTLMPDLRTDPVDPGSLADTAGQVIFHERRVDGSVPVIEVATATRVGPVVVVPLIADQARGTWVVEIRRR